MLSCRRFLYLLPPGVGEREAEKLEQEVPEFQIDELFEVIHHMSYEFDPRRKGSSSLLTAHCSAFLFPRIGKNIGGQTWLIV